MWFSCIVNFVYFSASNCTQIQKTLGATKLQYYHKIIRLSVVEENKIGEPCKEYGRGIICCTTSAPIKFYLIAPWFLVDERNE